MNKRNSENIKNSGARTREETRERLKESFGIEGEILERVTDKVFFGRDPYQDYIDYVEDLDALEQY